MKTKTSFYNPTFTFTVFTYIALGFAYLMLIVFIFFGCNEVNTPKRNSEFVVRAGSEPLTITEVDSCEYLLGEWGNSTVLTHKGNCKFCAERIKK